MRSRKPACAFVASVLPLVSAFAACSKPATDATPDAAAKALPSSAAANAKADAGTSDAISRNGEAVARALREGRAKAKATDPKGALAAFERGLKDAPGNPELMAEAAWVAFLANDLDKAGALVAAAIKASPPGALRAQALYTAGRIAERRGDNELVRRYYADSLALRENPTVRRRLQTIGGPPPTDDTAYPLLACTEETTSIDALCKCLVKDNREIEPPEGGKHYCKPHPVALGTTRLKVLVWGWGWSGSESRATDLNEAAYLLIARDGAIWRPVAELGREYHPGAFGVDNSSEVTRGEIRAVGKKQVAVVSSHVGNLDRNLGGLEACHEDRVQETVCALGDAGRPTRCIVIPVKSETGCGPGAAPDPSDPDAGVPEEVKARWGKSSTKLAWSLSKDGKLAVTLASGKHEGAPAGLIGTHQLF
jgi:hypothetical protein